MAHTETMLESREIFNGRVIRVTVDKVQLEDGTTSTREIVHHHGGACILPVDADGSVTMVRQFRYAFGEEIWELPAGKLEADEDPFEAAKRELSEECGLTADNFIDLGVVYATGDWARVVASLAGFATAITLIAAAVIGWEHIVGDARTAGLVEPPHSTPRS